MIASLNGIVLRKKPEGIIIDVHGVGYHVSIPLCNLADIPEPGDRVFLHTYTHVREDALQLYGFVNEEDRKVFTTLIGISGIGPKLGLTILSGMPVDRFIETISNEDVALLSTIPGLGKKTASKIILELKGKLPSLDTEEKGIAGRASHTGDAVSALMNLGYKRPISEKAVEKALKNHAGSIEDIIKESLKYLTEK
ncbi:MAG: Holliday junction branch migration protein RuvA [Nitrospiraceae bacterium]|nr:MAG: Holliday junction branch migration protein RuvA [Nitrospiraceae bacterium]